MDHRLFVGLRPPAGIRAALIAETYGVERARWQDDSQLHLTLRFAGDLGRHGANDLAEALERAVTAPFPLELAGSGSFDRKGVVHTLWIGVTPVPALDRLQRKVEQACQKAGLAPETRKFVPHVTLARLNASSGSAVPFLQRTASLRLGPWPVEEFILYESYLHPEGAVYEPVSRYRLRGA